MRCWYYFVGILVSTATSLTVYVDNSCAARGEIFDNALIEASFMANSARERLISTTDTDFDRVMERIFNFERTDEKSLQKLIGTVVLHISISLPGPN